MVILSEKGTFSLNSSRQSLNCARLFFSRALCVDRLFLDGGREKRGGHLLNQHQGGGKGEGGGVDNYTFNKSSLYRSVSEDE